MDAGILKWDGKHLWVCWSDGDTWMIGRPTRVRSERDCNTPLKNAKCAYMDWSHFPAERQAEALRRGRAIEARKAAQENPVGIDRASLAKAIADSGKWVLRLGVAIKDPVSKQEWRRLEWGWLNTVPVPRLGVATPYDCCGDKMTHTIPELARAVAAGPDLDDLCTVAMLAWESGCAPDATPEETAAAWLRAKA